MTTTPAMDAALDLMGPVTNVAPAHDADGEFIGAYVEFQNGLSLLVSAKPGQKVEIVPIPQEPD